MFCIVSSVRVWQETLVVVLVVFVERGARGEVVNFG